MAGLLTLEVSAATIYEDNFNFTGNLNNRAIGGTAWTTSDTWAGNGSSVTAASSVKTASLPFAPQEGYLYELSVQMANGGAGGTNWTAISFGPANPAVTGNFTTASPHGGFGSMILRENGNYQGFSTRASSVVSGTAVPGFAADTFYDFKITLNTAGTFWVTNYFFDGNNVGTYTWDPDDPPIGSVMLSTSTASSSARFDNFQLTSVQVPEASSMALSGIAGILIFSRRRRKA